MKNQIPKVAILMAAYNGRKWIEEQLHSIWSQENVLIDYLKVLTQLILKISIIYNTKYQYNKYLF